MIDRLEYVAKKKKVAPPRLVTVTHRSETGFGLNERPARS